MNEFLVSIHGDKIAILMPPRGPITKEQALRLAAYIVTLADPQGDAFTDMLDQVQS
jgi:hypothetical protein